MLLIKIHILSIGRDLYKVCELKGKLQEYLKDKRGQILPSTENQIKTSCRLTCFANIFHHMNQLDKSLQGPEENILTSSDKTFGFKRNRIIGKNRVATGKLEIFSHATWIWQWERLSASLSSYWNPLGGSAEQNRHYFSLPLNTEPVQVRGPFSDSPLNLRISFLCLFVCEMKNKHVSH